MTLHIIKEYYVECDGCGEKNHASVNPRFTVFYAGWRNGPHKKIKSGKQYSKDLCPDCVEEGLRFNNRQILCTREGL